MFVSAINTAAEFVRPIHFIHRTYQSQDVVPGAATLFIVNADGWALTCRHVAQELAAAQKINATYAKYRTSLTTPPKGKKHKAWQKELAKKNQYGRDTVVELAPRFMNCVDAMSGVKMELHADLDIALIKFEGFSKLGVTTFPTFAANGAALEPGKHLCRLGYPFPEFENFEYDVATDRIQWTQTGRDNTPRFPIEGMVTRHLMDGGGQRVGFEMSTPGLRGQSGGPAFDQDSRVWGMQSGTNHLDLNFDVDQKVRRGGRMVQVKESAFLHTGHCVHVDLLKDFMKSHNVAFTEG